MKGRLHRMPDFPKNASESSIGREAPEPSRAAIRAGEQPNLEVYHDTCERAQPRIPDRPIFGNGQTTHERTLAAGSCSARLGGASPYREAVRHASTTYTLVESIL
jgi:hypothetical protein